MESVVALPSALLIVGIIVATLGGITKMIARTATDGRLEGLIVSERLRREIWEARQIIYPTLENPEFAAPCLLIRTLEGDLVLYSLQGRQLVREKLFANEGSVRTVIAAGVDRFKVRRLGGRRPVLRLGMVFGQSVAIVSAAPLSGLRDGTCDQGSDAPPSDEEELG